MQPINDLLIYLVGWQKFVIHLRSLLTLIRSICLQ